MQFKGIITSSIRDTFFVLLISILVSVIMFKSCNTEPQLVSTDIRYKYKTDTVYKDRPYTDTYQKLITNKPSKVTPPKIVTLYKTVTEHDTLYLERDTIRSVNKNSGTITSISNKYIQNYPKAEKLLYFNLIKDSLKLTTLNIEGLIVSKDYPLYLDRYGYKYYDNELHHYKVNNITEKLKNKFNQLYITAGYELIDNQPTLGLEYSISINKLKAGINPNIIFGSNSDVNLNVNVGYRLF